jgi:hypothetical protein
MSDRLERMRHSPAGDWTIHDVEMVCREHAVLYELARAAAHITKWPILGWPKS